ncbi:nitroreductase [Catenulispora acidiphila DSM 44928]|uniref:Nitroreductase n=1 Tax=Catenulispora acidiphila (strain DSM 44928 / JCM 14897 / NBRC 102108 / NRRL B-24433 / ID139908) TaxID=479433 RepID=C7QI25_CATAD|nr:nitroreductase family protein [Catenulispora acidiphila]ACU73070.1 nitroreductase [Catenulispora acidiphila DSM 44928]
MGTAHDYLRTVMNRARVPMEPIGLEPDWGDKPRHLKYYPDAERLPLPMESVPTPDPAGDQSGNQRGDQPGGFSVPLLADMLRHSYGYLGRRLAPHANNDLVTLPDYADANWWRGTASGGGLYPVSVYWASGARGPVLPGLYHYSPPHHEMRRLLTGDVTAEIRAALGDAPQSVPTDTDQFLVLGLKFWQNAFKYQNFCYHAVTMDVGTILQSWQMFLADHGLHLTPAFWFDDRRLGDLLGVPPEQEGVFAVVPLPWTGPVVKTGENPEYPPRVRLSEQERSRRVRTFDLNIAVHQATMTPAPRPEPPALDPAAAHRPPEDRPVVDLPEPLPPAPARQAFRARRSSFGRFSGAVPTTGAELAAILAAASQAAAFACDVAEPERGLELAKFYVFVNHVRGVAPAAYEYDPAANRLLRVTDRSPADFLQPTYFLENYNLEEAGAVIVPSVRADALYDSVGDRGYRLVNAVVGAIAQAVYLASAGLGLGCGAALGFDNPAYVEELGLEGTDEAPLLILMVGRERERPADFRYEIG